MAELADPCMIYSVGDKGMSTTFGGFLEIEIVPQKLVGGLEAVADDESSVIWYSQVDGGPCGWD